MDELKFSTVRMYFFLLSFNFAHLRMSGTMTTIFYGNQILSRYRMPKFFFSLGTILLIF